jgi:hypothetical protein
MTVAACTGTTEPTVTTTAVVPGTSVSDDTVTTTGSDPAAMVAELQARMNELAAEIENSEAAEQLQSNWAELQAGFTAALAGIGEDGTVDLSGVEDGLEAFEAEIEDLGDQVEPELRDAWERFQSELQQLMP